MALNTDEAADKMENEVLKAVQEIQSSNKFILKRLNQLFLKQDSHCTCSRVLERSQKEVAELQTKVTELERILDEKDESQKELKEQLESLKERMDSIETSVMAVQTDDSKLRSASLRKEKAALEEERCSGELVKPQSSTDERNKNSHSSAESEKTIDTTEQPCQVAQVNSVKYEKPAGLQDRNVRSKAADVPETAEEGAVGRQPLQKNSSPTASGSEPMLKDKSSDQETTISTSKPNTRNILNEKNVRQITVEMVKEQRRETYGNGNEKQWRVLAKLECENGGRTLKYLEGVHSVICLDISASMAEGNAWTEATTFLEDYLKGLDNIATKYGLTNEHVAFVTFGHVTQVQKRLTNRYSEIRDLVKQQKLGGPSPLYGGLVFGLAAAGASDHNFHVVNTIKVPTKVIIVTDGQTSEIGEYAGPDTPMENLDETKAKILQCCEEYSTSHIDTYCVPVGNANKEYLELMVSVADGRMLSYKSGNQLARRHYLTTKVLDPFGFLGGVTSMLPMSELSPDDKRAIDEIKSDARKHLLSGLAQNGQNKYREIKDQNLAPIGSRVRRGPDWMWNAQDSHGPGTVIGHDDGDQVWVEWDTDGHQNVYRYGKPNYDVLIVEEPRELKPGQRIAVGCVVKPATKGQHMKTGTVIKLDENNAKAAVHWKDGEKGDYSYGGEGKSEIEVCTGYLPFLSEGHVLGSGVSTVPTAKKNFKNKNKNFR